MTTVAAATDAQPTPSFRRLLALVFLPFACGYFFSCLLRNINAVVFPELVRDFGLGPDALGVLTSAYFFAFAAFQLPLGLLLDRYGPRRVNGVLVLIAAGGILTFALATDRFGLLAGRALMGLGFAGGLMASMTAFVLWFPITRMATLSGWMLAVGAAGSLAATQPVELALRAIDWRVLFLGLAGTVFAAGAYILAGVPEKPRTSAPVTFGEQWRGMVQVLTGGGFWRLGLLAAITQAGGLALLGLWTGPWLRDVAGLPRPQIAYFLMVAAAALGAGGILFGTLSDWLAARGIPPRRTFLAGAWTCALALIPLTIGTSVAHGYLWAVFALCAASGTLSYPLLASAYPAAMAGRVVTAINMLTMACAFAIQAGTGALIDRWPATEQQYAPAGYQAAFAVILLAQLAALLWAHMPHCRANELPPKFRLPGGGV